MNMTPEQKAAIDSLRDAGYALTVYTPEELRGADAKAVENRVCELGNEAIDVLAEWIDPDVGDVTEVELQYDLGGQLLAIIKTGTAESIAPQKIDLAKLRGSYVHEVVVEYPHSEGKELLKVPEFNAYTDFRSAKAALTKMGMGYGDDLRVQEGRDSPEVKILMSAVVKDSALVESDFNSQDSRWTHVGDAQDYKVWIRRATDAGDYFNTVDPLNIFQCTATSQAPSNSTGGYPVLSSLLSLKGVSEKFIPNAYFPPEGYLCASEYTKDVVPGALYETTMGKVSDGYARYDMTITHDGKAFVPVHGNAKMDPCASAVQAGQVLQDYWDELPNGSKMLHRPPTPR